MTISPRTRGAASIGRYSRMPCAAASGTEVGTRASTAALTVARAETAVVEDQEREAGVGESPVVRLVELRVGQPHPPGPLDDERRAAAGFVGAMEEAVQPDAVAIEGDLIRPHAFDLYR